jgi:hypothetical protein
MKRHLIAAAAVPLVMFATSPAFAWGTDCRFARDIAAGIDVAGATQVIVLAGAGDLDVRGIANAARVEARGGACAPTQALLDGIRIDVRRNGSLIYVTTVIPTDTADAGRNYASATLNLGLAVPANLPLEVTDSSGDATIANVAALAIQDSSGDLAIRNVADAVAVTDSSGDLVVESVGSARLTDSSGDIRIARVARDAEIDSDTSGNIYMKDVRGNAIVVSDSSGDIEAADVGGDFRVDTDSSGTITHARVAGAVRLPD